MEIELKVLVITNTFPTPERPGATPCIKDQVEDLERLGVYVDVWFIDGRRRINYLWGALKILALSFQPRRYDLVHAFYGHSGALARLQTKYPVVATFLGSDLLDKKDGRIGKAVARWVDGLIVMTNEMKNVSGRQDARIIPFGANMNIFKPYPKHQARHELGLPLYKKLVLFPWNPARPEKRHWMAEGVVALLKRQYDIELLTVFNQPREIIAKYMNACDVMLLTSKHEGAPLAVREALACGLPVVSVDVGDVRLMVESLNGGYIAREDVADLAEKVSLVLMQKDNLFQSSATIHDSLYSSQQVLAFYRDIIQGRRGYKV
ncbi:MAG: glycosyltransferase [candidate division KSB1 bacterium]|nr:glycosyltransferase [candidate division KSB1 bacterium]